MISPAQIRDAASAASTSTGRWLSTFMAAGCGISMRGRREARRQRGGFVVRELVVELDDRAADDARRELFLDQFSRSSAEAGALLRRLRERKDRVGERGRIFDSDQEPGLVCDADFA